MQRSKSGFATLGFYLPATSSSLTMGPEFCHVPVLGISVYRMVPCVPSDERLILQETSDDTNNYLKHPALVSRHAKTSTSKPRCDRGSGVIGVKGADLQDCGQGASGGNVGADALSISP